MLSFLTYYVYIFLPLAMTTMIIIYEYYVNCGHDNNVKDDDYDDHNEENDEDVGDRNLQRIYRSLQEINTVFVQRFTCFTKSRNQ